MAWKIFPADRLSPRYTGLQVSPRLTLVFLTFWPRKHEDAWRANRLCPAGHLHQATCFNPLHRPSWARTRLFSSPHPWITPLERSHPEPPHFPQYTHCTLPRASQVPLTSPTCHSPCLPCALVLRAFTLHSSEDAPWLLGALPWHSDRQKCLGVHAPGLPAASAYLVRGYRCQLPCHGERQREGVYCVLQRAQRNTAPSPKITFLSGFFAVPILLVLLPAGLPWEHLLHKSLTHSLSSQNLLLGSLT